MTQTMKAIVITKFGGPEVLEVQDVAKPKPEPGCALIKVKAFGLNHAEMHMRKGEWDEWNPITGLECAGIVEACPSGELKHGQKVVGVMGGMGRNRPGGYGEFVNVPISNVAVVETELEWEQVAALPETYSTAYTGVHTILDTQAGESILIRGATSTIGQAAVHLAVQAGANVTATTRRKERLALLTDMGAKDVKIESAHLEEQLKDADGSVQRFDKVLNLVGNSVLLESIALTRTGGRMLQAGWLGGLAPVKDFNPMLQMESGVHFSLFHSKELGTSTFPLHDIPLQAICDMIAKGKWQAKPTAVFDFHDIRSAHKLLDSQDAGGKVVVRGFQGDDV